MITWPGPALRRLDRFLFPHWELERPRSGVCFSKLIPTNITVHSWILYVVVNSRASSPRALIQNPFSCVLLNGTSFNGTYVVFLRCFLSICSPVSMGRCPNWIHWTTMIFFTGWKQAPIGIELPLNPFNIRATFFEPSHPQKRKKRWHLARFVAAYLPRPQARFVTKLQTHVYGGWNNKYWYCFGWYKYENWCTTLVLGITIAPCGNPD